jgi:hypothetical protein
MHVCHVGTSCEQEDSVICIGAIGVKLGEAVRLSDQCICDLGMTDSVTSAISVVIYSHNSDEQTHPKFQREGEGS